MTPRAVQEQKRAPYRRVACARIIRIGIDVLKKSKRAWQLTVCLLLFHRHTFYAAR